MVFTSIRRIIRRGSPFAADRSHIHHLMQDLGFSDRRALVIIVGIHLSVTFIGLMLHRANTPEYFQFGIFLGCFGLYSLLSSQLWLVAYRFKEASPSISVKFNADGSLQADGSLNASDTLNADQPLMESSLLATEKEEPTPEPAGTNEISNITPLRKND